MPVQRAKIKQKIIFSSETENNLRYKGFMSLFILAESR